MPLIIALLLTLCPFIYYPLMKEPFSAPKNFLLWSLSAVFVAVYCYKLCFRKVNVSVPAVAIGLLFVVLCLAGSLWLPLGIRSKPLFIFF